MKKFLALCLAVLLCVSTLPAMAAETKSPLYIEGSEGVTLTYWIPMSATQSQYYNNLNEHPFYQWLEEQTGVHIEFVHPSEEQMSTQFTLMLSSGNYYDLMFQVEYPDGPAAGVADGVFEDLNKYADLMPNYQAALNSAGDEYDAWEWGPEKELYTGLIYNNAYLKNTLTTTGELWCATQIARASISTAGAGCLIRKDWLDEAGLDIPETVDEWEVVLETFKQRGEDVYGMNLTDTAMQAGCGALVNMFDIYPSWYTVKPGTDEVMVAGWADDNAKDYFTLMNKWYEAGYIDPDFMNRGDVNTGWDSLLLSDRLGILVDARTSSEAYEAAYTGEQAFDLEPIPMPRLSEDQQLHYGVTSGESRVTSYTTLSGSCKNKEIAAQWLDKLYTYEAFIRANYGVEGESYVMENGVPYFTDWYYNNEQYDVPTLREIYLVYGPTAWGANYSGMLSQRSYAWLGGSNMSVEKQKTEVPSNVKDGMIWGLNADNSMAIGWVSFEGDAWAEMYDPYTEAATYANAMALKFITGVEPIENFEAFQQKALDLGFAKSLEKMQEAYNKSNGIE